MPKNDQQELKWMVWIAIALSGVSLLVSFIVLGKVEDLGKTFNTFSTNPIEEIGTTSQQSLARSEAQLKLMALQTRLQTEETVGDAQQEVENIRMSLEAAYDDGTEASQEQLNSFAKDLDKLEVELREDSAAALKSIQRLLDQLETQVQP